MAPPKAAAVRVLVAIEPHMYRQVLAFHLSSQRPRAEVFVASGETLLDEAERTRPHLIVANDVPPELKERGVFWVEVHVEDGLAASISADGYSDTVDDVSLQDLLGVVDKAQEELAHGS